MADWLKPNTPLPGYRGIWFNLGQDSRHGPKYSGGLGTYTCKHAPLAVYAPAVDRTFFVWGSTCITLRRPMRVEPGRPSTAAIWKPR
ncbi:MAG: hypothetical protein ACFE0O_04970 [Opitutales bacterium]